jgi:hypothetical protein
LRRRDEEEVLVRIAGTQLARSDVPEDRPDDQGRWTQSLVGGQ